MVAREDIAHLLRRVGFAPTAAEIDALTALTWTSAVDRVLDTTNAPAATAPAMPDPNAPFDAATWNSAYYSLTNWWLERARTTTHPIIEKMTLFWHGHMPSSIDVVPFKLLLDQNQLYRSRSMGKFDALVQGMAIDPAMLMYLDNRANVKGFPNENFARELMELFVLGVGNYSESDVRESARAWTGHTMNKSTWRYEFRADWHDTGAKSFMGDVRNWDGPQIVTHLLRGPKQRVMARFIAKKLWTNLVYANPSAELVDALASAFIAADLSIKGLLRAILLRPEFLSTTARNGHVRSPFEWVVACLRCTGQTAPAIRPQWLMQPMGQIMFGPPNVDGWGTHEYWISTTASWSKAILSEQIARAAASAGMLSSSTSKTPANAAADALAAFGITAPTAVTTSTLTQFVSDARASAPSAERWGLMQLAMLSPEFQMG